MCRVELCLAVFFLLVLGVAIQQGGSLRVYLMGQLEEGEEAEAMEETR